MTTKKNAIVAFKVCPKCHGLGKIPCDGKEFYRQRAMLWAEQFHLMPVVVKHRGELFPGLAVRSVNPGGWGAVKVYVAVTEQPKSIYDMPAKLEGQIRALLNYCPNADYIGDRALWYMRISWGYREDIHLLDHWPDILSLEDRKLIEEFSNKQRASER